MLYKSTPLNPFQSSSHQEIYMKLHLYMMYMKIHTNNSQPSNEDDKF